MAKQVIKRGGKRETFQAEKIRRSIRNAAKGAQLPAAAVKSVVSKVSRAVLKFAATRKVIATATLQKKILSQLDKTEPGVARAWRKRSRMRRARRKR